MDRRLFRKVAAVAMAVGMGVALATPTGAVASPGFAGAGPTPDANGLAPPAMVAAVAQDLGLSTEQAQARLAGDLQAMDTAETLTTTLGSASGGTWIDDTGQLVAATTTFSQVAAIRAAGATPRLVPHSLATLDNAVGTLNRAPTPDAAEVHTWYVDVTTNSVVVEAAPSAEDAAAKWAEAAGAGSVVRVETSPGAPQTLFDVVGGYPYTTPSVRCSVAFAVQPRGFLTAGHCGTVGTPTTGHNGAAQGTFQRRTFPGAGDRAYVAVNSNWRLWALVYRWNGTYAPVNGSANAPNGALVCRSGSTNGYTCGNILARNQTVNYPQGTVTGLLLASACAGPGDSGGALIAAGINAQGITSGGSGFCGSGQPPRTFFEPVNRALNAFGLSLVTR